MAIGNRIVQERPVLLRPNMQVISHKEKVCGYARVSTDNPEQEDSYIKQCEHFTKLINSRTDWEFAGVYADEGITGTQTDNRKDFLRMMDDCRVGKINRILVKSVSRFARNTVDTLTCIRELKELGVSVFFEAQNIDTMTPGGEVLLTILAAMAEQESRNMSTNIKWAYQKRFKDGEVLINCHGSLGYEKDPNGKGYVIVEEEAEIVRRIFREFIGGSTPQQIADRLMADGIKSPLGKDKWSVGTIQNMLRNEKYTGNAILGKSFKPDVLSKSRKKNNGQAPSYYVQNSHPAIITEEMYELAQAEITRRKALRSTAGTGDGKYSSKYALSGLLVCADCGSKFRRYGRKLANGENVATWVCITHQKHSDRCGMLPLKEEDIHDAYRRVMNRLAGDISEVVQKVRNNIDDELNGGQSQDLAKCEEEIITYQKRILELFRRKREGTILSEEYDRDYKEFSEKVIALQAEQAKLKEQNFEVQLTRQRLMEITEVLSDNSVNITDDTVMKMLIDYIKVNDKHEIEFEFKCGLTAKESL